MLEVETIAMVKGALEKSWSSKTSACFNPEIAPISYGQCAPTAVVVHEWFGGEIFRTSVKKIDGTSIRHFYNFVNQQRFDFTESQFAIPDYWSEFNYEDIPSNVSEALTEMLPGQIEEMRSAFKKAMSSYNRRI